MKRLLIIFALFPALAFAYIFFAPKSAEAPASLTERGFSMKDLSSFTITDEFGSDAESEEARIFAASQDARLRIKVISHATSDAAKKYAAGQSLLLLSQYDPRLPPYPEFLTNQTGCDARFMPVRKNAGSGTYYLLNSDMRFNYGLCADELIHYKAGFGIFYCPEIKKIVQIEYFIGKDRSFDAIDTFMRSFACTS